MYTSFCSQIVNPRYLLMRNKFYVDLLFFCTSSKFPLKVVVNTVVISVCFPVFPQFAFPVATPHIFDDLRFALGLLFLQPCRDSCQQFVFSQFRGDSSLLHYFYHQAYPDFTDLCSGMCSFVLLPLPKYLSSYC